MLIDRFFSCQNQFSVYAKQIIQNHHERWDGTGYPNHLKGDEIPLVAQIVGLVDVYDALVNKKVYRGAYDVKIAEDMIITGKCGNLIQSCWNHL